MPDEAETTDDEPLAEDQAHLDDPSLPEVLEDREHDDDAPAVESSLPASFTRISDRCDAVGIECVAVTDLDGAAVLRVKLPAGRSHRLLTVRADGADAFLAVPFERYRYLDRYDAIYSCDEGTIEALVRSAGSIGAPTFLAVRRLFGPEPRPGDGSAWPASLTVRGGATDEVGLELGVPSKVARALLGGTRRRNAFSLTLLGCDFETHDAAEAVLHKYSDALFFQIDAKLDVPLQLGRRREPVRRRPSPGGTTEDLTFPRSHYDREPMSLYWYARGATGMPLLQFLAYYQVIEFYLPVYSQEEVRRRLRNVVKDPAFNPHSEREIGRLVEVLTSVGGRNTWGDERSQLRTTVRACVDANAIRGVIGTDELGGYFEKKSKQLADTTLRVSAPDDELVSRAAERIYEIRCKIVHAKGDAGGDEVGLLLPFSPEADRLGPDIDLVQLVARRVLAAAGKPFGG